MNSTTNKPKISGIILAGGKATRMGGSDKGLMPLAGQTMVSHVIARIKPQVDELFINANREVARYQHFDLPVLTDQHAKFIGPLAGFQLGLKHAQHDYVLTVPCDAPLVDEQLADRLLAALQEHDVDIVVAKSDGHTHPVFCLCKKSALTSLETFIDQGNRKVSLWQKSLSYFELDMSAPNADGMTESFININTTETLAFVENKLKNNLGQNPAIPDGIDQAAIAGLNKLLNNDTSCESEYDPNSLSVKNAKHYIHQFLSPIQSTEEVTLADGLGRVLATDIIAPANVPNYDNSAMDGFAFNAKALSEGNPTLEIIGTILAGDTSPFKVGKNQCARIMTGGMMPEGADTVVMQEHAEVNNNTLSITTAPKPDMNVRHAGEDMQQGQVVFAKGHWLKPADIGLIASLGVAQLTVYTPLTAAVFSTGDELVQLGTPLEQGQVYDSNRYSIISTLKRLGVKVIDKGAVADDPKLLEETLLAAADEADVVITSGGVSVGQADYMKQLLSTHGKVLFWKLAMKPGRPLAYGKLITKQQNTSHYFGLPGNPVAVMVTFYQFVREALLTLMGQSNIPPMPTFQVQCESPIKKLPGRTEFQRGIYYQSEKGDWRVKTTGAQGSAMLSSMSAANCFIILDESTSHLPAGSIVSIQLFDGLV